MKKLILIFMLIPTFTDADFLTLGEVLETNDSSREVSEKFMGAYFVGFADGYMSLVTAQFALAGKSPAEAMDAGVEIGGCLRDEDLSILYARLLVAAREEPDKLVYAWVHKVWHKKCEDQLRNAVQILRSSD